MPLTLLAHPLLVRGELPVSAFELAFLAVCLLLVVSAVAGRIFRRTTAGGPPPSVAVQAPIPDPATAGVAFWLTRAIGLSLLVLAVAAGILGSTDELSNIAPVLVVGAGWPLLLLGSLVLGDVWLWLNPFDTLARALTWAGAGDGDPDTAQRSVWWAVLWGALWMGYITVWPTALSPRSVGTALSVYTFATLAGCLATGRRTWLQRGEFFTVYLGLLAGVRRYGWRLGLPRGGGAVCGVVAGGALFGLIRDSDIGTPLAFGPNAVGYSRLGVVVAMVLIGALAEGVTRFRSGTGAAAAVGLIPTAAGLALAMALARYRFTTSVQLLPVLASDPFGAGVDLFGTRGLELRAQPFDVITLIWAQAVTAVLGSVGGILLARRRAAAASGRQRVDATLAAVTLLSLLVGIGVAAIGAF